MSLDATGRHPNDNSAKARDPTSIVPLPTNGGPLSAGSHVIAQFFHKLNVLCNINAHLGLAIRCPFVINMRRKFELATLYSTVVS